MSRRFENPVFVRYRFDRDMLFFPARGTRHDADRTLLATSCSLTKRALRRQSDTFDRAQAVGVLRFAPRRKRHPGNHARRRTLEGARSGPRSATASMVNLHFRSMPYQVSRPPLCLPRPCGPARPLTSERASMTRIARKTSSERRRRASVLSVLHPQDYIDALGAAYVPRSRRRRRMAIAQILTNSRMCAEGHRPMCQDTGIVVAS